MVSIGMECMLKAVYVDGMHACKKLVDGCANGAELTLTTLPKMR